METTKLNDMMNRFLENKEFKFVGPIIYGTTIPDSDIDFKVKVIGTKEMISVGDYYDYTVVEITLVRLNDKLSQVFFDNLSNFISSRFLVLNHGIESYVRSILKPFDIDVRVKVEDIVLELQ